MELAREQLIEMGNKWLEMQFITREDHFKKLFSEMYIFDYITLTLLIKNNGFDEAGKRVYLSDLKEEMDLPMENVSKIVQGMQSRGVIYWNHDASDRPGTFITMSEMGREALSLQEKKIECFFETAIGEFSKDEFIKLIELRSKFNEVMEDVLHQIS